MKKNMGSIDKTIGVLVAVIIGVLYFTNVINGTLALVLGAFAIVFLITSFTNFCPLYTPFGIDTHKKKE